MEKVNKYARFVGSSAVAMKRKFKDKYRGVHDVDIDENVNVRQNFYFETGHPLERISLSETKDVYLSDAIELASGDVAVLQREYDRIQNQLEIAKAKLQDSKDWLHDLERVRGHIKTDKTSEQELIKTLYEVEELLGPQ